MAQISYSAVVLDERSRLKLINYLKSKNLIPEGYEILAHHMTINMGEIKPQYIKFIGLTVRLAVVDYAVDDKVMAVGVTGFESDNVKPHITIAVNRTAGGKPVMSNNLTDWKPIRIPLNLTGKVTEVPFKF